MVVRMTTAAGDFLKHKATQEPARARALHFVTGDARCCQMRPLQREPGFAMLLRAEQSRDKPGLGVAGLAAPSVFAAFELAAVLILMAYCALLVPNRFDHAATGVAFLTVHGFVQPAQGKPCARVVELSGFDLLPSQRSVAALAVCPEFFLVHILVAAAAVLKTQRFFEITAFVAGGAIDFFVQPDQGKARFRVVETPAVDTVPACCGVATRAIFAKGAFVHIGMAVRTGGKSQPGEFDKKRFAVDFSARAVANDRVTFGAIDAFMLAGQPELCPRVIEARGRLPAFERVAGLAFCCKLATVLVFMAGQTVSAQPEKCFSQIDFRLQLFEIFPDECRLVAVSAVDGFVLASQCETREGVIEIVPPVFPVDQFEIATCMLGMAGKTAFFLFFQQDKMQPALFLHPGFDFFVAIETFVRLRTGSELMAGRAPGQAFEKGMRPGQLTR